MISARESAAGYGGAIDRGGWRIRFEFETAADYAARDEIIGAVLDACAGRGPQSLRRSRRGATYCVRLQVGDFFVKLFDGRRGRGRLKRWLASPPAAHIRTISNALRRAGLHAPAVVMWGSEPASGRELVATPRAPGVMLTRYLRALGRGEFARKRLLMRAIGAEIARLHRAGFIHGDLTPFNIIVEDGAMPQIWFIDHERTNRAPFFMLKRARLRNLVQLGHFSLAGLTYADRMRVWSSYAAATSRQRGRGDLRRLSRMLKSRVARDGALETIPPAAVPARNQVREG